MNRSNILKDLQTDPDLPRDVLIIGGGATGLGIAVDAVTRGYKTILLEKSDFAKGTSSRSTKLVHGGVRYLAQGDILLVAEALRERGMMLKNASHLTANQEFVIPAYSLWDVILYTVGLKFYDLLAGRLSLGKSYFINRKRTLNKLPLLRTEGLKGGIVYHDGQFDDARMAVTMAGECVKRGGTILNYFEVTGFLKDEKGKISGVKATDLETGNEFQIRSKLVINATGVFADTIHRMDNPSSKPTIRPSQGVHIVLDKTFLGGNSAIMIPKTDDGRVLFAIPWYDKVVVGTTDTPLNEITNEPKALEEEINFILKTAGNYLTKKPSRADALCIFAGLRPLAANPDNPEATKEVSRRHKITLSSSGLLSIVGGKWTSYRRMAEETIDKGIKAGLIEGKKCITKTLRFYSNGARLKSERLRIYGNDAAGIEKLIADKPELGGLLDPRLPYSRAEIMWICQNEMPRKLEDLLARRTRAMFLDARASSSVAPEVAEIMARELKNDGKWAEAQVKDYNKLLLNYL